MSAISASPTTVYAADRAATSTSTKLTLIAAHLIAAVIIVPLVSRRLASTR